MRRALHAPYLGELQGKKLIHHILYGVRDAPRNSIPCDPSAAAHANSFRCCCSLWVFPHLTSYLQVGIMMHGVCRVFRRKWVAGGAASGCCCPVIVCIIHFVAKQHKNRNRYSIGRSCIGQTSGSEARVRPEPDISHSSTVTTTDDNLAAAAKLCDVMRMPLLLLFQRKGYMSLSPTTTRIAAVIFRTALVRPIRPRWVNFPFPSRVFLLFYP